MIDREIMVDFSQCIDCKNYIGKNKDGIFICNAFKDGIPDASNCHITIDLKLSK